MPNATLRPLLPHTARYHKGPLLGLAQVAKRLGVSHSDLLGYIRCHVVPSPAIIVGKPAYATADLPTIAHYLLLSMKTGPGRDRLAALARKQCPQT